MTKIYLDPGHGGGDSGANGNDIHEKEINLKIVKKIAAILEKNYQDIELKLSRETDEFIPLKTRTDEANAWKADVFLSVHINSSTYPTAKGFESHVYTTTNAKTKAFQNVMHAAIMKQVNDVEDRGKKFSNFHVLRESNMPAILTENLFISNVSDATKLKDEKFLDKLALGHANGLQEYLGLQLKPIPKEPVKTYFQVIAGTFENLDNATKLATQLEKDGYRVYIDKK